MVAPVAVLLPVAVVFARAVAQRVAISLLYNAPRVVPAAAAAARSLDGTVRSVIDRGVPLVAFVQDVASNAFERMAQNEARYRRSRFHPTLQRLAASGDLGFSMGSTQTVEVRETDHCPLQGQGYDRQIPSAMVLVGGQPYMMCLTGRRSRLVVVMRVGADEREDHWLRADELPPELRAMTNRMQSYITVRFGHPSQAE